MIVFGVDPGTLKTGFGVIEFLNSQYRLLDFGTICPPAKAPLEQRYLVIFSAIEYLITKHKPHSLAVETQFVDKNVQSAIKLGMARGVCLLAAARANIHVKEYTPTMTKKATVGKGHASKQQVQYMISRMLNISQEIEEDAADALALALCHLHTLQANSKIQALMGR